MAESIPEQLIQCADHKLAPWSLICVHLMNGTSTEWLPIDGTPGWEVKHDWLCPVCMVFHEQENDEENLDNLRPVCIHCVRGLQARAGFIPPED